jgi:hypothetical protein
MTMSPEPIDRFTYACDATARIIHVVAQQTLTVDEVLGIMDRQAAEGRWSFGMLFDLRRVDTALSKQESARVSEHAGTMEAANGPQGPVALVTSARLVAPRAAHAIRMKRTMLVEIFWDPYEAQRWLTERLPPTP